MKLEKSLTLEEIQLSVASELGVDSFPLEPLRRAAARLVENKRVEVKEEGRTRRYSINKDREDQLLGSKLEVSELYEVITKNLVDRVEFASGKLSAKERETIIEVFDLSILSIFAAMETPGIAILMGGEVKGGFHGDVRGELGEHVHILANPGLERIVKQEVRKSFLDPTPEIKRYLVLCASNSFIVKLLNLDPNCQSLQRSVFSSVNLYLDTNILISVLFPGHELCTTTREILRQSRDLGVNMFVTSRTLEEFNKVIERSDELFVKLSKSTTRSRYYTPEHTVIQTFARYAEPKGDTWETYVLAHKQDLGILERQYGVKLDQTDYRQLIQKEKIDELSKIVLQCSQKRQNPKSVEVAEHDSYHFLLIDYRRTQSRQNDSWFLSHDSTFDCVNCGYFKLENKSTPCSMFCSGWLEIVFPFMSPDVSHEQFEDVFARIVGSDFFSMTKSLSFGNLTRFFAPFFGDDLLTEGDFAVILQNQVLKRIVDEWEKAGFSPEYDDKISEKIAELVDKRKEERINKMEKDVEALHKENEGLTEDISRLRAKIGDSQNEYEGRLGVQEKENASLKSTIENMSRRVSRNRRYGELFSALSGLIVFAFLLLTVRPRDSMGIVELLGGGITVGLLMLGAYRWITGDSDESSGR